MYGMIHKSLQDMICEEYGKAKWEEVFINSKANDEAFLSLNNYSDNIAYSIISSASRILNIPAEQFLKEFGIYWVLKTAKNNYSNLINQYGKNSFELLTNINSMHEKIASVFINYAPPIIETKRIDTSTLHILYRSTRKGFTPFMLGIIEGLAVYFDENIVIEYVRRHETSVGETTTFILRKR
jgi:hypothetical protein